MCLPARLRNRLRGAGREPQVFVSYAYKDKAWKERLIPFLSFALYGSAFAWSDDDIEDGVGFTPDIIQAMDKSNAAIVLVSADSLSSRYVNTMEVPYLLERKETDDFKLVFLIIRPCPITSVPGLRTRDTQVVSGFSPEPGG